MTFVTSTVPKEYLLTRIRMPQFLLVLLAVLMLSSPVVAMQDNTQNYDDITEEVSALRGLEILEPVVVTPMNREQLGAELEASLEEDYPPDERYADERELIAFGLMDPEVDLGQLIVELYTEQVAGYYDPESSEMVVVQDGPLGDSFTASEHVTYAHEVVHALQDQHFDLDAGVLERENLSDDQSLAITALIEGDATLSELQYLLERPDLLNAFLSEIGDTDFDSATLDNAPPLIVETLLFPYDAGYLFVEVIYDDGGWEAVNAAFADPPQSTEQILHPEKYLVREEPDEVDVADFTPLLGDNWVVFDMNTFGEYQVRVILEQSSISDDQAAEAAAGWGGDTYVVAGTDTEDAIHWVSTWDTDADALQFAQAFATYESDRWEVAPNYVGNSVMQFESDGVITRITLDGDTVTYLKATDAATLEIIASSNDPGAESAPM
ncbi:hypothetical protein BH20CHL2_BH20CHL2_12960 [soil metagenome]